MGNGTIVMDNDDWTRIEGIVKAAVEPLNTRMDGFKTALDNLPCGNNTTSIVTLEAQRDAAKEQKKDKRASKDWLLKIVLGAVTILVALQAIGFFQRLTK